jgi:hypothetical protein
VSSGDLTFAADEQAVLPPVQAVVVTVTNKDAAYFGAAFLDGDPGWVNVTDGGASGTSLTLLVGVNTTALPPGRRDATLTVGIADANQNVLATQEVRIHYTISARLNVLTPALSFAAGEVGAAPPAQPIDVVGTGIAWSAAASHPWIHLDTAGRTGPGRVGVTIDHAGLAPGLYQGSVTIQAAGGGASFPVPVSLDVRAAAFGPAPAGLAFSGVNGTLLAAQALPVAIEGGGAVAWTATSSDAWIVLGQASGTTPGSVTVQADPTRGPLASGTHTGTITLSATVAGRTFTADVPVQLGLSRPTLTATPDALVLGGVTGREFLAEPVTLTLSTGAEAWAWSASASAAWAVPSASAGTVSAAGTGLTVAPDPAGLAAGTHAATIDFQVAVNGDLLTASVPVTLAVDQRRLLASDSGVALAKTPTLSKLGRTLTVRDNFGGATAWEASSDQPWLEVTASGTTPGELVLTADPARLGADALHEATVTVAPAVADGRPPEVIRVGLWVGSTDPAPATTLYYSGHTFLAVDPVRPYAYVHSGGSAITVYNVFTEQVVGTIASVAAQLGDMTISNDGATLFVTDRTNFKIVPVSLATRTKGTPFAVGAAVGPTLHHARTNGRGLVLTGNGCIFDAASGAVAWPAAGCTSTGYAAVTASLRGNIWAVDSLARSLDATAAGGGAVLVGEYRFPNVTAWNTADYAFDEDGTRMYLAVKSPYDFYVADSTGTAQSMPHVQTLPGNAYPNNVEVARDGRIFAGNTGYGKNAWIYAPDGTQLRSWEIAYIGVLDRMLKVSGDGLRLVALVETGGGSPAGLSFTTVAP